MVSTYSRATSATLHIQQYYKETDTSSAEVTNMGKAISKEIVQIFNNQFNSAKAHLTETMENHRNSYITVTIVVMIFLAIFLLILYACSRYCLLKCKENMNSDRGGRDVQYYVSRSPYHGYADPFVRFQNRFAENGDETVEMGGVGVKTMSHGMADPRMTKSHGMTDPWMTRTNEYN